MKYPYWVRHNDIDYAPGAEVPVEGSENASLGADNDTDDGENTLVNDGERQNESLNNTDGENHTDNGNDAEIDAQDDGAEVPVEEKPEDKDKYIKSLNFMNEERLLKEVEKYDVQITPDADKKVIRAAIIEKLFG